jgi:hypothetical protein
MVPTHHGAFVAVVRSPRTAQQCRADQFALAVLNQIGLRRRMRAKIAAMRPYWRGRAATDSRRGARVRYGMRVLPENIAAGERHAATEFSQRLDPVSQPAVIAARMIK